MPTGTIVNLDHRSGSIRTQAEVPESFHFDRRSLKHGELGDLYIGMTVTFRTKDPRTLEAIDVTPMLPAPDVFPPYRFVPIQAEHALVDTPVWHDGSSGGELLSGELRCTLRTLTPTMPGSFRYAARHARGAWEVSEREETSGTRDEPVSRVKLPGLELAVDPKKQIAEPLRTSDGRVLIAGSSIKGMLRQSLSALLSAPMERVGERHYSYMPNLAINEFSPTDRSVSRPAIITSVNDGQFWVKILPRPNSAIFFCRGLEGSYAQRVGTVIKTIDEARWKQRPVWENGTRRWVDDHSRIVRDETKKQSLTRSDGWKVVSYQGGADADGVLGTSHDASFKPHRIALVQVNELEDETTPELLVSSSIVQEYRRTQANLSDKAKDHLAQHPKLHNEEVRARAERSLKRNATLPWCVEGQLVYVEVALDHGAITQHSRILSIGHSFRYRWTYTSSVHLKGGRARKCLSPRPFETPWPEGAPPALTGARVFFGYVSNGELKPGINAHSRLAGRIAINHAVSTSKTPTFINSSDDEWAIVPLKILGQPKPSAVECYLRQEGAQLATYGDLPGDEGGDLAGRKFYLHQPKVERADYMAQSPNEVRTDQATLARYLCDAGNEFRFTLRFARLREWELGALLCALEPGRLDRALTLGSTDPYAHKLGLGRPLGLGSVALEAKQLRVRTEAEVTMQPRSIGVGGDDKLVQSAIAAFIARLGGTQIAKVNPVLLRWLAIHRFADRGRIGYPVHDGTIFGWHTNLRRRYAKARRSTGHAQGGIADMARHAHQLT